MVNLSFSDTEIVVALNVDVGLAHVVRIQLGAEGTKLLCSHPDTDHISCH